MHKLWKRSHHFREIHYLNDSCFVADVFQFTDIETRPILHSTGGIYCSNCIFVNTSLFDPTFKEQNRWNFMMYLYSIFITSIKSHNQRIQLNPAKLGRWWEVLGILAEETDKLGIWNYRLKETPRDTYSIQMIGPSKLQTYWPRKKGLSWMIDIG